MTSIANNPVAKIAAIAVSLMMMFAFATPALAITQAEATAIITALGLTGSQAAVIQALVVGGSTSTTTGGTSACAFTGDLTVGSKGADVTCLQNSLISKGYSIPAGATGYFGAQTVAAVKAWQTASGVSPAAGYFGPKSRTAFAAMGGGTTTTGGTLPAGCTSTSGYSPTTGASCSTGAMAPAGTGLSVMAGTQPANSLAPQGATRVPFTRFVVTAGSDGDVVINSVVVQRTGLGSDAAFGGVVLIDEATSKQLGSAKTFNSNHQLTVGEAVTIAKGTSKTFLLAGNMAASLSSYAGEAPMLSLITINTSAAISGSFPIQGAAHTTNSTLTVGSLTSAVSSSNAANSASSTKEIGTTGFKASGFRLTANSEDIRLRSIRLNQVGSIGSGDIANVVINVGGTAYPATVSADGKFYTASLGSGIVITKGNNVEVYTQYDVVGGSSRTIIFHVDKSTDIYATGETYGYGATTSGGNTNNPYYFGQQVTVSGATVTTIQKSNSVAAQNITPNVPNQPLGAFETDIKGETITVQAMSFSIATSGGADTGSGLITNVSIVDENGAVVAGPIDATYTSALVQTLSFTDTVSLKTGKHTYSVRGKLPSAALNGETYTLSTTPSTGWTTVVGETTGNSVSLSANGNFSMNTMTIKSGSMAVTRSTTPSSKTVIAGASAFTMANLQFDASQSGEDIRFSSVLLSLAFATGVAADINNCQIYDGAASISDTPFNPSGSSPYAVTATLSEVLTVAKGTVKTLSIKCNVATGATNAGTFTWDHGTITSFTFTGVSSAQTITGTAPSDTAVTMTVGTGSLSIATDSSSPAYKLVAANSTDVVVGAYQVTVGNETVNLTDFALQLTSYASSSIADIVKGSIYDGATKLGDVYFTSDGGAGAVSIATSTFTTPLVLQANTQKVLTVKLDLSLVGNSQTATSSGKLIAIDYNALKGVGVDSGTTFDNGDTTGSTAVSGIRMMKSFPLVTADTSLASTGLIDGKLGRFKITADSHGPIGLTELNLTFATTTAVLTNVNIHAFEDSSYSQPVSTAANAGTGAINTTGQPLGAFGDAANAWKNSTTNFEFTVTDTAGASTTLQIPAGVTRYFEIRGTITGSAAGATVVTTLMGDSYRLFAGLDGVPAGRLSNPMSSTSPSVADAYTLAANSRFMWSPNSTTTALRGNDDWTNGTAVSGLPSNGLIFTRGH